MDRRHNLLITNMLVSISQRIDNEHITGSIIEHCQRVNREPPLVFRGAEHRSPLVEH